MFFLQPRPTFYSNTEGQSCAHPEASFHVIPILLAILCFLTAIVTFYAVIYKPLFALESRINYVAPLLRYNWIQLFAIGTKKSIHEFCRWRFLFFFLFSQQLTGTEMQKQPSGRTVSFGIRTAESLLRSSWQSRRSILIQTIWLHLGIVRSLDRWFFVEQHLFALFSTFHQKCISN